MTLQELIADIADFSQKETQRLIAKLERSRFQSQGAFNGNDPWLDNSPKVIKDKGRNEPLVDSGHLEYELENPDNWDLKPQFEKDILTLNIPETEHFTESKYDVLQTGGKTGPYLSRRGNIVNVFEVPARQFKNLSEQDIQWIYEQLVESIKRKYA